MACVREHTIEDVVKMYRWCVQDNRCNVPVSPFIKATLRQILLEACSKQPPGYIIDNSRRKIHIALFEDEWNQIEECLIRNPLKK